MKRPRYVLPLSVLPTRLPIGLTAIVYLLCDRFDAPGWVWGVIGTVMALLWIGAIGLRLSEETKPLNGYGEEP